MFTSGLPRRKTSSASTGTSSMSETSFDWIRENITALKCVKFVPTHPHHHLLGPTSRCCCGANLESHCASVQEDALRPTASNQAGTLRDSKHWCLGAPESQGSWKVTTHTAVMGTNAYGIIAFQAGPHPTRAKYARLHYETPAETVLSLLFHEWRIRVPNLVISVIGGLANTSLQAQLQQVVYRGLLRAAKTTVAWVLTNGLDLGVTRHVGDALGHEMHIRGSNIVVLGIAPWGCVQHRQELIGLNNSCAYTGRVRQPGDGPRHEAALHACHNYFLFADNGTSGRFGGEQCLRQRLEQYLAEQPIDMRRYGGVKSKIPVVGVLLEGNAQSFRTVLDLVTGRHPVPVVVCDGSGGAADILAFVHRFAGREGELPRESKQRLIGNLCQTFHLDEMEAEGVYSELRQCMKRRYMISVFRMGEGDNEEIDITILTAMLRGSKLTPAEQLSLTMAWDRPDIAKSKVFQAYPQWSTETLEHALADALLNDRIEFVRLLVNKGIDVQRFLTVGRLEKLYIASGDAHNQAFHELFAKVLGKRHRVTLSRVGRLIEVLVGGGYQHNYCDVGGGYGRLAPLTGQRRLVSVNSQQTSPLREANHRPSQVSSLTDTPRRWYASSDQVIVLGPESHFPTGCAGQEAVDDVFRYPYTELLQWALLTRRYRMARFMVLSGEESVAKALFAVKLLRCILSATVDEDTDGDLALELKSQAQSFEQLAVDLQEHCYRDNAEQTMRLLTYELLCFSHHTCLSLAYFCESKPFIGHPCAQAILNDLWYGGLRKGNTVGFKTSLLLIGMALPPLYPMVAYCLSSRSKFIEFKTKKELAKQPQTLQEHLDELDNTSVSSSTSSSSTSSSSSSSSSTTSSRSSLNSSKVTGKSSRHRRVRRDKTKQVTPSSPCRSCAFIWEEGQGHFRGQLCGRFAAGADSKTCHVATEAETLAPAARISKGKVKPIDNIVDPPTADEAPAGNDLLPVPNARADSPGTSGEEVNGVRLNDHICDPETPPSVNLVPPMGLGSNLELIEGADNSTFCVDAKLPDLSAISTSLGGGGGDPLAATIDLKKRLSTMSSASTSSRSSSSDAGGAGRPLSWHKRIVVFFSAPVTRFYLHVLLYLIFILFYSGLSIHTLPIREFSFLELYVYLYIVTFFLDRFREVSLSHGSTFWRKLSVHLTSSRWSQYNLTLCLVSMVGIGLRYLAMVYDQLYMWGKNLLIICCAFWQLRFFEFMRMWRFSGAYTYMVFQMLCIMNPMLSLLLLPLVAFGTLRQGIMYPNQTSVDLTGVKGIMLKPYFMMYGEVYAGEIDPVDWPEESLEAPFFEVVPIAMSIYMLYSMILFTSLVMALFRDVYADVLQQSEQVYNFIRYAVIIDFDSRPLLPPPFIVFSWIHMAVSYACRSRKRRKLRSVAKQEQAKEAIVGDGTSKLHQSAQRNTLTKWHAEAEQRELSVGLKLFLTREEMAKLHTFEGECVDDYWRQNRLTEKESSDGQENVCNKKLDQLQLRLDDVNMRQTQARSLFHGVEARLLRLLVEESSFVRSS